MKLNLGKASRNAQKNENFRYSTRNEFLYLPTLTFIFSNTNPPHSKPRSFFASLNPTLVSAFLAECFQRAINSSA